MSENRTNANQRFIGEKKERKTMKKTLFVILAIVMIAGTVAAQAPPSYGGSATFGWGLNNTSWNYYTGTYSTGVRVWNPSTGWFPAFSYAPITLELWIELSMIETYYYTSYQWHRLGGAAETIVFTIDGTVQANHPMQVSLTKFAADDGNHLNFITDLYGSAAGSQIGVPIVWQGRWGNDMIPGAGNPEWYNLSWVGNDLILPTVIPACDHWIQFKGEISIPKHQPDGYYKLTLAGCPVPEM
jgi:hypothetical protein